MRLSRQLDSRYKLQPDVAAKATLELLGIDAAAGFEQSRAAVQRARVRQAAAYSMPVSGKPQLSVDEFYDKVNQVHTRAHGTARPLASHPITHRTVEKTQEAQNCVGSSS